MSGFKSAIEVFDAVAEVPHGEGNPMQNPIWKLVSLAGVIGLTCLAVVVLQRNAPQTDQGLLDPVDQTETSTDSDGASAENSAGEPPVSSPENPAPGQPSEPRIEPTPVTNPAFAASDPTASSEPDPFQTGGIDFNSQPTFDPQPADDEIRTVSHSQSSAASDPNPTKVTAAQTEENPFAAFETKPKPTDTQPSPDSVPVPENLLTGPDLPSGSVEFPGTEASDSEDPPALIETETPRLLVPQSDPSFAETEENPFQDGPALVPNQAESSTGEIRRTAGWEDPTEPTESNTAAVDDPFPALDLPELDSKTEPQDELPTLDAFPELPTDLDNPAAAVRSTDEAAETNPFAPAEALGDPIPTQPDSALDTAGTSSPAATADPFDPFALDAQAQPANNESDPAAATTDSGQTKDEFPELDGLFPDLKTPAAATSPGADKPSAQPAAADTTSADFPTLAIESSTDTNELNPQIESADDGGSENPFPGLPAEFPSTDPAQPAPTLAVDEAPAAVESTDSDPSTAQPISAAADDFPSLETVPQRTRQPAEPNPFVGEATADSSLQPKILRPQLKIEKSAPDTAILGQPFIYRIKVRNVGSTAARDVIVEDRIPKGAELTGTIPRAELVDKKLTWRYPELGVNEEVEIAIRVVPREHGPIGSVATVTSVAQVAAQTQITSPKLQLTLKAPEEVDLGEPVAFDFVIQNTGTGVADNVVIHNVLPTGLSHPQGNDLEYEVGTIKPNETRQIRLTLQTTRAGEVINEAVVSGHGLQNVKASAAVKILGHRLKLTRTSPKSRYVGLEMEFENKIENASSRSVQQAVVVETIPEGLEFVEATGNPRYNQVQRTVAWTIDRLDPSQSHSFKVKVVPRQSGTQTSVIELHEPGGRQSRTVSTTDIRNFTSLGVDMSEVTRPLVVGERIVMTVRARNRGTATANNVRLRLDVPEELEVLQVEQQKQPVQYQADKNTIELPAMSSLGGRKLAEFEIMLRAKKSADVRLGVQIEADELSAPVKREEAILIVDDSDQ